MTGKVEITSEGRSGTASYREPAGSVDCYWELGGNEILAIVNGGSVEEWRKNHAWALPRRLEILRFIADEMIRQEAPGCLASIDGTSGTILLKSTKGAARQRPSMAQKDSAWVVRYRQLRTKLALFVLAGTVLFGGAAWVKTRLFVIDPGSGTPTGLSVRSQTHVATLLQTLVPYTPSPNRDHSKDRYDISVFVVPLDGQAARHVRVVRNLSPSQFALARILGSDGQSLWIDVGEVYTLDLATYELQTATTPAPRVLDGGLTSPFPPRTETYLCAGVYIGPETWLGLHSVAEIERDYQPGKRVRRIVLAENRKEERRFYEGKVDGEVISGSQAILTMTPLEGGSFLNAALLRLDDKSEPLRLENPAGAVMIFTSEPGLKGELVLARIDDSGQLQWQAKTGVDRFSLQQILPGEASTAFVGTRPREEGKVPEPVLVIVDNLSGTMASHSLWQ